MNRKRSNVNPQNLPQSKRLRTPSATQGSSHRIRTPRTNAVAFWDPDGPEWLESPTATPFNVQDQCTVLPSKLSMPSLAIQQTDAAISSTSEVPPPQSTVHPGVLVQSHEVLYGRPGAAIAIGEHCQNLQSTQTEGLEGNYFQHTPYAEEISAQFGVNALFGFCNSLSDGSRQPSMSLSGNQVLNDQWASLHRSVNFTPSLLAPGTSIHDPYDSWRTLAEVYNVSHSHSQHIEYPSDPPAIEEHYHNFQGTLTEGLEGYYFQHAAWAEESSAQSSVNAPSGTCNVLSEGSRQPSMSLSGNQVLNDQGASLHQSEKFTPSLSTLGTSSIHNPYDPWRTLAEVYNVSHSQAQHIPYPSDPWVAQFPVQNSML